MSAQELLVEHRMKNPSRGSKRVVLGALAALGLAVALRLAAFQLGFAPLPPEPFFGDGSRVVLTSALSRALPIPDAALGAIGYAVELLLTVVGGTDRWRSRSWLALLYAAVAAAMAVVAVLLAAWQALGLRAGCTLCLVSAMISLVIVGPALAEGRAALAHVLDEVGLGGRLRAILHRG